MNYLITANKHQTLKFKEFESKYKVVAPRTDFTPEFSANLIPLSEFT